MNGGRRGWRPRVGTSSPSDGLGGYVPMYVHRLALGAPGASGSLRALASFSNGFGLPKLASCGQEFLQYGNELPRVEWLGEKVAPQASVSFGRLILVQRRDDDPNGRSARLFSDLAEPFEDRSSLTVGELKVEDCGVKGRSLQDLEGCASGGCFRGVEARLAEAKPQHSGHPFIVLDNKYRWPAMPSYGSHCVRPATLGAEGAGRAQTVLPAGPLTTG